MLMLKLTRAAGCFNHDVGQTMKRTVRSRPGTTLTRTTKQSVSTDGKPQSPSQQNNSSGAAIFLRVNGDH